ncbi:MAG: response regulator transcription factor [Chloroflexi bacterium]|nr:response regulator transcription factor [Chloroflexota bacterium]
MSKIRILICDDHTILRDGIRLLLDAQPDMEVIAEAADGREAVEKARALKPDVILMDIAMPLLNGIEATKQIRREQPDARVLVLTMYENDEYIAQMLEAGAAGYVLKKVAGSELVYAIHAVGHGETFLYPSITRRLVEDYLRRVQAGQERETFDGLTDREREILQLIAEGHATKKIAALLNVSGRTVQNHRAHIMEKLGMHNRSELIRYALEKGIIELPVKRAE